MFDGGSVDETVEVLRSFGERPELRWVSERDGGVVDAVNKGLRRASGEVLAIQSSDDVYLPGAVEAAVAALEADVAAGFVYGDAEYVDESGSVIGQTHLKEWNLEEYLRRDVFVIQSSAFFRASVARAVGFWDEDVPYAADSDYWLRLGAIRPARKVERLLSRYRYHEAQRDKAGGLPARDWERAVRKRRAEGLLAPETRRAMERGIHLTWHHYTPQADWRERTRRAYRALLAEPDALRAPTFPRRELLPGREPIWKLLSRTKRALGALALDKPPFAWPLLVPGSGGEWDTLHNRNERIARNPDGPGWDCDWEWTSDLNLPSAIPAAGDRLLRLALRAWPVRMDGERDATMDATPDVSFIVGHRGEERLPLLLATLRSLRSQKGCSTEIVVVEQAVEPILEGRLPEGVKWVHQQPRGGDMRFSRSWAFNRGVLEARGRIVVLHDNDILAPAAYAAETMRLAGLGFEAMRLQRYVFYLDEESTKSLTRDAGDEPLSKRRWHVEAVRQNCQGGTIAVTKDAYARIGGHDESFLGWGGEDNEFFDRCRILRFHPWSYLPFVHLWHAPQAGKRDPAGARSRLKEALAVPAATRAAALAQQLALGMGDVGRGSATPPEHPAAPAHLPGRTGRGEL